jgi:hypothetical protein
VKWGIPNLSLESLPPYKEGYWASPEKYEPASLDFIEKEFKGRKLRLDPWENKAKRPTKLLSK